VQRKFANMHGTHIVLHRYCLPDRLLCKHMKFCNQLICFGSGADPASKVWGRFQ